MFALIELGRLEEALNAARDQDALGLPLTPMTPVVGALLDASLRPAALRTLAAWHGGGLPGDLFYAYALLGEPDLALEALDRWFETQPYGPTVYLWWPAVQRLLGEDPRFRAALSRISLESR